MVNPSFFRPLQLITFTRGLLRALWVLFAHSAHPGMSKSRTLAVATISLFILCTAHLALLLASTAFSRPDYGLQPPPQPLAIEYGLAEAANAIWVTSKCVSSEACKEFTAHYPGV